MSILINGRFLSQPLSGVQRYAREIVRALDEEIGESAELSRHVWRILSPVPWTDIPLRNIAFEHAPSRFQGHLWEQTVLSARSRGHVVLNLAASGPLIAGPQVVVVHDAAVYRHPEHFGWRYRSLHRFLGRHLAGRAKIGTVSEFSRRELAQVLRIAPDDIVVAPNGSEHFVRIVPDLSVVAKLGSTADEPFFMMVGNLTRNKNASLAIEAISKLPARARLAIVGGVDARVFGADLPDVVSRRVVFTGRLSDEEVAGLMRQAAGLIFPSRYEGFGIPPLEAMMNDCPVVASAIPPVQEVCGPAASYFDPNDSDALVQLMSELLQDSKERREGRVHLGRERAQLYSWRASARRLASSCIELMP